MKTANLYKCKGGYAWDANYPMGDVDLINAAQQAKTSTDKPFIPLGRRTLHERALAAVESYSESNARQGYTTREQAEYGKSIRQLPIRCKKPLRQKLKEWFTEVEE